MFIAWEIWKACNKYIFDEAKPTVFYVCSMDLRGLFEYFKEDIQKRERIHISPQLNVEIPHGYFDGVAKYGVCIAGIIFFYNRNGKEIYIKVAVHSHSIQTR